MFVQLGDLLVQQGLLTPDQRDEVLDAQTDRARPFGVLAEEMFGVSPHAVEDAWTIQYAQIALRIDPRRVTIDGELLGMIERRQAWQFGLIPVQRSGSTIQCVTSQCYLTRAMRFVGWRIDEHCSFAICEREALLGGLEMHYPMGMDCQLMDGLMDTLAAAG